MEFYKNAKSPYEIGCNIEWIYENYKELLELSRDSDQSYRQKCEVYAENFRKVCEQVSNFEDEVRAKEISQNQGFEKYDNVRTNWCDVRHEFCELEDEFEKKYHEIIANPELLIQNFDANFELIKQFLADCDGYMTVETTYRKLAALEEDISDIKEMCWKLNKKVRKTIQNPSQPGDN